MYQYATYKQENNYWIVFVGDNLEKSLENSLIFDNLVDAQAICLRLNSAYKAGIEADIRRTNEMILNNI